MFGFFLLSLQDKKELSKSINYDILVYLRSSNIYRYVESAKEKRLIHCTRKIIFIFMIIRLVELLSIIGLYDSDKTSMVYLWINKG